jgi:lysyl-tRNA synthetase class 2
MRDWRPSASLEVLRLRARLLERIRAFFARRGILEVETPVLSRSAATDPALASFLTRYRGPGHPQGVTLYLHTSPEFAMKRLLAAGSGSIYQICRVFRDGECGRLHQPEFTMIEWYRVGFDHHALMDEVAELIGEVLAAAQPPASLLAAEAAEKMSYREAFLRHAGIDPFEANTEAFLAAGRAHGLAPPPATLAADELDGWRDWLLTHLVEPKLGRGRLTFLYDYPASQAALARIRPGDPPLAERFECYLEGVELANGFHELTEAVEQRARFERDLARRRQQGLPAVPVDEELLAALEAGLPEASGVALGFDRLVMLAAGAGSLAEVMAFAFDRA